MIRLAIRRFACIFQGEMHFSGSSNGGQNLFWEQEVACSNHVAPTFSKIGRALELRTCRWSTERPELVAFSWYRYHKRIFRVPVQCPATLVIPRSISIAPQARPVSATTDATLPGPAFFGFIAAEGYRRLIAEWLSTGVVPERIRASREPVLFTTNSCSCGNGPGNSKKRKPAGRDTL